MVTPELLTFIKTELSQGKPVDDITASLAMSGWAAEDIQAALTQLGYNINQKPSSSKRKPIMMAAFIILFLLIFGSGTTAVLAAYGKIPVSNPKLKLALEKVVIGLPFMPKTPDYVVLTMLQNEPKVTKQQIALAVAVKTQEVQKYFGQSGTVFTANGPIDYTDANNVQASLNVAVPKYFNADVQLINKVLYLKLNQLPDFLLQLGVTKQQENELTAHWMYFDGIKENANNETDNVIDQQKVTTELPKLQQKLLPYLSMSDGTIDGNSVYQMKLQINSQVLKALNDFGNAISKTPSTDTTMDTTVDKSISDFYVTLAVDKNSYYMRKVGASLTFHPDELLPPDSSQIPFMEPAILTEPIPVEYSITFSDFNNSFAFTPPTNPVKFEDEIGRLQEGIAAQGQLQGLVPTTKLGKTVTPTPKLQRIPLDTNVQGAKTVQLSNLLKEFVEKLNTSSKR